jgi:hypothetical protein
MTDDELDEVLDVLSEVVQRLEPADRDYVISGAIMSLFEEGREIDGGILYCQKLAKMIEGFKSYYQASLS